MAAFPPGDREAFVAHWLGILGDDGVTKKTIFFDGEVARPSGCWRSEGRHRRAEAIRGGPMWPMDGRMGAFVLFYVLIWVVVVAALLTALWRGALAQERIARHLEGIERALAQRPLA
jgi:hypothetical protein